MKNTQDTHKQNTLKHKTNKHTTTHTQTQQQQTTTHKHKHTNKTNKKEIYHKHILIT